MTEIFNPKRYRVLSEPFASMAEAEAAVNEFHEAVSALRVKHHIPDLSYVAQFGYLTADGEEAQAISDGQFGSEFAQEQMLAWSLGKTQERRQERIGRLLAANTLKKRARRD